MHDPADAEIVKKIKAQEIELTDRNSVLRGSKPTVGYHSVGLYCLADSGQDFSSLRTMFADRLKRIKEAQKTGVPPPSSAPKIGQCRLFKAMLSLIPLQTP